jgi:hypothetical protein
MIAIKAGPKGHPAYAAIPDVLSSGPTSLVTDRRDGKRVYAKASGGVGVLGSDWPFVFGS